MLDNNDDIRRCIEFKQIIREAPGSFAVKKIEIGELSAAMLNDTVPESPRAIDKTVTSAVLMRVFPVSQLASALKRDTQPFGESVIACRALRLSLTIEPCNNRSVIL